MNIEVKLTHADLLSLVLGHEGPYYSHFEFALCKRAGRYVGGMIDRWQWDKSALQSMNERQLWDLYRICKESWEKGSTNPAVEPTSEKSTDKKPVYTLIRMYNTPSTIKAGSDIMSGPSADGFIERMLKHGFKDYEYAVHHTDEEGKLTVFSVPGEPRTIDWNICGYGVGSLKFSIPIRDAVTEEGKRILQEVIDKLKSAGMGDIEPNAEKTN